MSIKNMSQDEKVRYMTTEPIPPLIAKMAIPTIISMLVTTLYNMVDTLFVGKLDNQSTAAVSVAFSLMAFLQAIGFFFGHGSGNYISRKLGAREYEDAERMASTGFFSAVICGTILMIVGFFFSDKIAMLLGSTDTVLPFAESYLKIIFIGAPFMLGSFVVNNQLRFQGNASFAMIGIVTGGILNIGLDPLFIFVFDMKVAGAALATIISQFISFMILIIIDIKKAAIKVRISKVTFTSKYFSGIFKGGIPSLCRQGIGSVAAICLNFATKNYAGALADAGLAAMGVVTRITMFANSVLIGFGQGFQPVCGTNYGAKKYERVKEAFMFCVKVSTVVLAVIAVVGFIFAGPAVGFFRDDPDVIKIGTVALRAVCIVFPLNGLIVITNMFLQTIGYALKASIVSSARQGIFFIPFIFIIPHFFGLFGVEICQAIADVCTFFLALPFAISEVRKLGKESE